MLRTTPSRFPCLLILAILFSPPCVMAEESINVVVWDEQQPKQKQAYANFLGNQIANYLKTRPGLNVTSVRLDDPEQGLPNDVLDSCDVLLWWGHVRQDKVTEVKARQIVDRVKAGDMALVPLHSAHWSLPFMIAMEDRAQQDAIQSLPAAKREHARVVFVDPRTRRAPKRDAAVTPSAEVRQDGDVTLVLMKRPNCCFPAYRADGAPSTLHTRLPDHPIAKGVPDTFTIRRTEMYDEPFHVPEPDAVIFEETWELGEHFRSGSLWNVGKGKVFYFRPGHETYSVFTEETPLLIIENAVRWLASTLEK